MDAVNYCRYEIAFSELSVDLLKHGIWDLDFEILKNREL
jgi:hypothetical protein